MISIKKFKQPKKKRGKVKKQKAKKQKSKFYIKINKKI